jgi:uncharacterized protein YdeI (YjbR/CyaY-like superfamily)
MADAASEPIFFASPAGMRAWLEEHHDTATELIVGYWKKHTGKPSLTWSQAVDEALCFGWIDSRANRIDDDSYRQRFTPRKKGSNWSLVNVRKVEELTRQGRMTPRGLEAFEGRDLRRQGAYAFEQARPMTLDAESEAELRANEGAWAFWERQPAGYRRTAAYWVMSARRPETRRRRMQQLIEDAASRRRIRQLASPTAKEG